MRKTTGLLVLMLLAASIVGASGIKSGISAVSPSGRLSVYKACPPGSTTAIRAIDDRSGAYFEATWTVVHDTNTKGAISIYDLAGGSPVDSLVGVRLLPGLTYGGSEFVGDSVRVTVWDVDDTSYVFGVAPSSAVRNWQGD